MEAPDTSDDEKFCLDEDQVDYIKIFVDKIRNKLRNMPPAKLRASALMIFSIERLPKKTQGINCIIGFRGGDIDGGNWAGIFINMHEDEFSIDVIRHYYDDIAGGDTESETIFSADSYGSDGNIEECMETYFEFLDFPEISEECDCDFDNVMDQNQD